MCRASSVSLSVPGQGVEHSEITVLEPSDRDERVDCDGVRLQWNLGRIDASTQGEIIDVHRQLDQTGAGGIRRAAGCGRTPSAGVYRARSQPVPKLVEALGDHLHQRS